MSEELTYPKGFDPTDPKNKDIVQRTQRFFDTVLNASDEELLALVRESICLEARDSDGWTALIFAALYGNENISKTLIGCGADIEARDEDGRTALMWAATCVKENISKALISCGADIEARDDAGRTALMLAAENGLEINTKLLIECGANIEEKDSDGNTALMWAAANYKENTTRCLLEHGANVYARSNNIRPINEIIRRGCDVDIRTGEAAYADFAANHTAPTDKAKMYQLLAFTPLVDDKAKVDYLGNLGKIINHARWDNKDQAENILEDMASDGVITPADVTTLLHQCFPPPNTHRLLTSRSDGRGR